MRNNFGLLLTRNPLLVSPRIYIHEILKICKCPFCHIAHAFRILINL